MDGAYDHRDLGVKAKAKAKAKVKILSEALLDGTIGPDPFERATRAAEGPTRGTLVEALEGATRKRAELVDGRLFALLIECLSDPAPRVRWEATRTMANVAANSPHSLAEAVPALLANTSHEGSVVRWATAHAVTAFLRAGYASSDLRVVAEQLANSEIDPGVRKIYARAVAGRSRR